MESTQSGLLERLRAQRESMQASAAASPMMEDEAGGAGEAMDAPQTSAAVASAGSQSAEAMAAVRDHAARIVRLESETSTWRQRVDAVEGNLRHGLSDLRGELPQLIQAEVARHAAATNEVVADVASRVGRLETDFTRERERWSTVVTNFDQRLDHRLRSFRQDVTVMLAGMAVLVLAMLMLLLMRR